MKEEEAIENILEIVSFFYFETYSDFEDYAEIKPANTERHFKVFRDDLESLKVLGIIKEEDIVGIFHHIGCGKYEQVEGKI